MKGTQMRSARGFRSGRFARGFTLIELLVVIAIIALLIGILLPSLGKARQSARGVAESSSYRQVTLASEMYTDDWEGFYAPIQDEVRVTEGRFVDTPFGRNFIPGEVAETSWRFHLWDYIGEVGEILDAPTERQDVYSDGYSADDRDFAQEAFFGGPPQTPDERAQGVPGLKEMLNRTVIAANAWHYWAYPTERRREGVTPFGRPLESGYDEGLVRTSAVEAPSMLVLFGPGTDHPAYPQDTFWMYRFDGPVRAPGVDRFQQHQTHNSEAWALRYDGKAPYGFADGSVKMLDPREILCNDDVCMWSVHIDGHLFDGYSTGG